MPGTMLRTCLAFSLNLQNSLMRQVLFSGTFPKREKQKQNQSPKEVSSKTEALHGVWE